MPVSKLRFPTILNFYFFLYFTYQWESLCRGADFRKSYLDVCCVSRLTTSPLCLLTGTADSKIKRDTYTALGLSEEDLLEITVLPDR